MSRADDEEYRRWLAEQGGSVRQPRPPSHVDRIFKEVPAAAERRWVMVFQIAVGIGFGGLALVDTIGPNDPRLSGNAIGSDLAMAIAAGWVGALGWYAGKQARHGEAGNAGMLLGIGIILVLIALNSGGYWYIFPKGQGAWTANRASALVVFHAILLGTFFYKKNYVPAGKADAALMFWEGTAAVPMTEDERADEIAAFREALARLKAEDNADQPRR